MGSTFSNLIAHIIFSTKERQPLISDELKPNLWAYMGGIVRELNGTALKINGTSDHVHMLIQIPPSLAISKAVQVIKANSSRWVHEKRNLTQFGWQAGYGVFSVSRSNLPDVIRYIDNQEEHHRKRSFQEELIAFLKKHEIKYDERYIWD